MKVVELGVLQNLAIRNINACLIEKDDEVEEPEIEDALATA